jgi:hypothetical protein
MDTGVISEGESGEDVKLITHIDVIRRLRMVELYFHSPHMSSWHGA